MNQTGTIVTIAASLGWLFLTARAYRSTGQTFERTALIAVCWALLFAIVAVVAAELAA